ncbi:HNH endonuclease signature motif containing protein [Arthrobacter sp. H5]|uniref:HNH endonuclease signature motif containing protein n=1 Tax=Arthrobacter sp. H5 TaxID=1267973 RepID=UPI0004B071CE|nr:HNH endonuclease signature motif containing protein [Arthrobacter sp. H5]
MATALLDIQYQEIPLLQSVHSDLLAFGRELASGYLTRSRQDIAATLVEVEELSKVVDYLQVLTARAVEDHDIAATGEQVPQAAVVGQDWNTASGSPVENRPPLPVHKNSADYLRAKIGISRSEANRRLRLAVNILPDTPGPGTATQPALAALSTAVGSGSVSGRAATVICDAVQRVRPVATPRQLDAMEHHLTRQAIESDEDILRVLAGRWENTLDQDGQEPTDKVLKARQGVFLRGRRNGLHFMEIGATDEQFEHLVTVMNTATNPRVGKGSNQHDDGGGSGGDECGSGVGRSGSSDDDAGTHDPGNGAGGSGASGAGGNSAGSGPGCETDPERPTRAQSLLDGLVSACQIALSSDGLPTTGGHRPQVMVTINHRDLVGDMERAGHSVFAEQMSARSIRKLACDADIIPLVLGGKGQLLDIGRSQRLFPAYMRRALVARDKGCTFPDCSIPATWCEAHHINPWAAGGTTGVCDGCLLCARHHHVLHEGDWTVESIDGIPWFRPPKYLDPDRIPRRNTYWQVEQAVQQQLQLLQI